MEKEQHQDYHWLWSSVCGRMGVVEYFQWIDDEFPFTLCRLVRKSQIENLCRKEHRKIIESQIAESKIAESQITESQNRRITESQNRRIANRKITKSQIDNKVLIWACAMEKCDSKIQEKMWHRWRGDRWCGADDVEIDGVAYMTSQQMTWHRWCSEKWHDTDDVAIDDMEKMTWDSLWDPNPQIEKLQVVRSKVVTTLRYEQVWWENSMEKFRWCSGS